MGQAFRKLSSHIKAHDTLAMRFVRAIGLESKKFILSYHNDRENIKRMGDIVATVYQWQCHVEFRVFPRTPWPEKKKKKFIYNNLNFFYLFTFKKKNRNTLKQNQEHPQNFYAKQILK